MNYLMSVEMNDVNIDYEIKKYISTGDTDPYGSSWQGANVIERARNARRHLRSSLANEVRRRAEGCSPKEIPCLHGLQDFAQRKVAPMVEGLFSIEEQGFVLKTLTSSILFITGETVYDIIQTTRWDKTAWDLANLYLLSLGADLLGKDAPTIVGLSEETTYYISSSYFHEEDRFADFLVHEAAHIFHNCKRSTAGLEETRTNEWLLPIAFNLRETFAYACEAYSCIVQLGRTKLDRMKLLEEQKGSFSQEYECIDYAVYWQSLESAVSGRNGWKKILENCRSRPTRKSASQVNIQ